MIGIIIGITFLLSLGWYLVPRRKARRISVLLNLTCYAALFILIYLRGYSFLWLILITTGSMLFAALIPIGLYMLFGTHKGNSKEATAPVKQAIPNIKNLSADELIAELVNRGKVQ